MNLHDGDIRQAWAGLRYAEHADGLLRAHGWRRVDALAALAPQYAEPIDPAEVYRLLDIARQDCIPLLASLSLPGELLLQAGVIDRLGMAGNSIILRLGQAWLQIQERHIASAWIVRTPTRGGVVCSVELFDLAGLPMLTLNAARQAGCRESCEWRLRLAGLLPAAST